MTSSTTYRGSVLNRRAPVGEPALAHGEGPHPLLAARPGRPRTEVIVWATSWP